MSNSYEPNRLTQDIINFCKNPSEMIFVLSEHSQLISGRKSLAKIPLEKTLIGLILISLDEFEGIARGATPQPDIIGFFSSYTEKLYLTHSFEYSISWYFNANGKDTKFPIEYEEKPTKQMLAAVGRALSVQLKPTIELSNYDINNRNDISWALPAFFDGKAVSTELDDTDMLSYDSKEFVSEQLLRNADYEQYLINPEEWVAQAQAKVMDNSNIKHALARILRRKMEMESIIELVKKDETHFWHKTKRLLEAIQGKKSVLVRLENVEFKMYTEGLDKLNGVYSSYYIHPDDRYKVLTLNNKCSYYEFGICDIKQVLYRGKVIYAG